jgi:hypothetical protein
MICTFGDIADVTWWRERASPCERSSRRMALRPDLGAPGWESVDATRGQRFYDDLVRLSAAKARAKIVEHLKEAGDLRASRARSRMR